MKTPIQEMIKIAFPKQKTMFEEAPYLVLPLANDRVNFKLEGDAVFMGGWNSGTFDETSPIGKDWVDLELGINRVFIKAGRKPGKVTLAANCANGMSAKVELETKAVVVKDGIAAEAPQASAINVLDYTCANPCAPLRDLEGMATSLPYKVFVNGVEVEFPKKHGAFKPDAQTGVVCPYVPVLQALTNASVKVSYEYSCKVIPRTKAKKYLREAVSSPHRSTLTMKVEGGKEIDAVAGLTVLFEDNGAEKNLTNYEMTAKNRILAGELGPLLGYIPGIEVITDERTRRVDIKTK